MVLASGTLAPGVVAAQDPADVPGADLAVYLLTAEPGDQVWELFGHIALLVRNTDTGREAVYHYGLFDFASPGFVPRFLKGEMMYSSGRGDFQRFLRSYGAANRKVVAQELNLTPVERLRVLRELETAVLPENRVYRYEYYLNNCSTKIRDVIDAALGGQLEQATASSGTGVTWRDHTRRLTSPTIWYAGFQILLGPKGDEPTSAWEEMWIPMRVRDIVRDMTVDRGNGDPVPLVASEELWTDSTRPPEPTGVPGGMALRFLLGGFLFSGVLYGLGHRGANAGRLVRLGAVSASGLWALLCAFLGLVLIAVHWTDHEFMYWNQNALLFTPLGIPLLGLLPGSFLRGSSGLWTRRLTTAALGLALFAAVLWLMPWTRQGNGELILFALPVHATLWWIVNGRLPEPAEVGEGV